MTIAPKPARILIIAGSDSGGGAGIQADIKTVTMLGGYAMTAITAITAQNTISVEAVMPVPPDMVLNQIDMVLGDIGADAIKIGMIGSAATAVAVAERLEKLEEIPIVFDPVMVATIGAPLADETTIAAFERLMRLAHLVTPNLPELEILSGLPVGDEDLIQKAAEALQTRFGCAVLAKGGHGAASMVTDLLIRHGQAHRFLSPRLDTADTHGTGCTLASAVASGLGAGLEMEGAVERAIHYVQAALAAAPGFGKGHGPIGHTLNIPPADHLESAD